MTATESRLEPPPPGGSLMARLMEFVLRNKLAVAMGVLAVLFFGIRFAPFDWDLPDVLRDPVPVDAIPDTGENQQIVFTEWPGRTPRDVDDQVTFPLTTQLQGVRGVKTIRASSMFGFSSIYVIFHEREDFETSRFRLLEKLNSLPRGILPNGVQPRLGPDATALGQIFWYTLEGRDEQGNPTGGWDLEELRTIQDWYVRFALQSAEGVSEVASAGGYVREYQVDVDPDAMRYYGVSLADVYRAVRQANIDVSAKTVEINQIEYFVRGIGFIKRVGDLEEVVVKVRDNVPVLLKHVATVSLGPAVRRGALDKDGVEAVGGVVVARFGANPLKVIQNVKEKIHQVSPSLGVKVLIDEEVDRGVVRAFAAERGFEAYKDGLVDQDAWLEYVRSGGADRPQWLTVSAVEIVPFYDRTGLIRETLATLGDALINEALVTVAVVVLMVISLRVSMLVSATLPLAVLMCFVAMKLFGVDANIVALSGIAIAIGTIVDMGIVICENIVRHIREAPPAASRLVVVRDAAAEVGGAVLTAVMTTIVGFLPVFTMTGPEGKLFKPLAFTKTFALIASIIVALTVIPPAAYLVFRIRRAHRKVLDRLIVVVRIGAAATAVAVVGIV
ncbi:MAG: efflux RND transporter permease subunit, partial [Planctomycetota bacterium]